MDIQRNTGVFTNHCCSEKEINITYFCVCVRVCTRARKRVPGRMGACVHVALLIQHAIRMRHVVTSFVAPLTLPHFLTLSHKWHDF